MGAWAEQIAPLQHCSCRAAMPEELIGALFLCRQHLRHAHCPCRAAAWHARLSSCVHIPAYAARSQPSWPMFTAAAPALHLVVWVAVRWLLGMHV
jgi:hypothetical protein